MSSPAGAGGELAEAGADHRKARTRIALVVPGFASVQAISRHRPMNRLKVEIVSGVALGSLVPI
jgi:hypothetical protein